MDRDVADMDVADMDVCWSLYSSITWLNPQ